MHKIRKTVDHPLLLLLVIFRRISTFCKDDFTQLLQFHIMQFLEKQNASKVVTRHFSRVPVY